MNDGPRSVDAALADLALVAVARLRMEMTTAKNSKDRIAAANSILDRLGFSRTQRAQAEVADREIQRALEAAMRGGVSEAAQRDLEKLQIEADEKVAAIDAEQRDKEKDQPKLLTRAAQAVEGQRMYDEARAESDLAAELAWAAAEPGAQDDGDEGLRDFSQLGPDDEETDSWLKA